MIVPMRTVTLLCLESDREDALSRLRDLGALHVVPVEPRETAMLRDARAALARGRSALSALARFRASEPTGPTPAPQPADRTVEAVHALLDERARAAERIAALQAEVRAAEPYGDFDPALVGRLREKGIGVRLIRLGSKASFQPPDGALAVELSSDASGRYVAVVGPDAPVAGGEERPLPSRALSQARAELEAARADADRIERDLRALGRRCAEVEAGLRLAEEQVRFLDVRDGMGASGPLAYLRGYCPVDRMDSLRAAARSHGWGLADADPAPGDAVPTLIRSPAWVRPIGLLFRLIGVTPGYQEADISVAFLLFYSLFFAILVGDAGYGLLFLILTGVVRATVRKAPRDLTRLLAVLSVCTIVWGVLTGTYFGIATLPPLLERARVPWLADDRHLMSLCFLIGAIHLTLAHAWNGLRTINSLLSAAQAGWIGMTWTMYWLARFMILDYPLPPYTLWVGLSSLAAILLFMTPARAMKTEWPNHVMLPLTVIGNFGDVVSYVRLFAVGSAGTAIARAFNEMAVGEGISSLSAGLVAALILFAAHSLNILLCGLGVIVHGVRLNTLEFCGHMGIQWTGFQYRPFARAGEGELQGTRQ